MNVNFYGMLGARFRADVRRGLRRSNAEGPGPASRGAPDLLTL